MKAAFRAPQWRELDVLV
jgi:hypothetical protein